MTKFEIQLKKDGHHKAANLYEKKGKRAGKESKEYALYLHHVTRWVHYSDMLEAGSI